MFTPAESTPRRFGGQFGAHDQGRGFRGGPRGAPARSRRDRDEPYIAASPQLAMSPLHRGHRTAIPRREALILLAALNHPWLLHDRLEELAETEFRHPDTKRLKAALIDIAAHALDHDSIQERGPVAGDVANDPAAADRAHVLAELGRAGHADILGRIHGSITTPSVWGARPDTAASDVLHTWKQLLALHRQWHSLTRELKDAELALGQDNSEANYTRLIDVKSRLSTLDGTEALIEGFGGPSGRPSRSL
jgi:DNA primase